MALIITLSLLVLVTIAVMAFFTRAAATRTVEASRSNQILSSVVASSATAFVTEELLKEIIAGSTEVDNGIYRPNSPTNMIPRRILSSGISTNDSNFFNLVRQSLGGDSTTNTAGSARAIQPAEWNTPLLLGGEGFTSADQTPTWIYLNRDGTTTNAATTNAVGRFAYNAYDIGGLLDINVAGHAADADSDAVKTKGHPVWADLTAIPGINSAAKVSSSDNVRKRAWPPTWRLTGQWPGFQPGNSAFDQYLRTGWRSIFSAGGNVDRMFHSRQDLIRYARANPGTFTPNPDGSIPALQYFTHWSRDRDLPTHEPDPDRPKVQQNLAQGGNDAHTLDDALNPSLLTVRKMGGEPAIQRRFTLSRLQLVSTPVPGDPNHPAPSAEQAPKIQEYFGLTWDGTNNRWVYDHGDPNDILPLSDIPANREPDFFELLKAAISAGSLGKQYGIPFPAAYVNSGPSRIGGDDGSVNYQVIQIAANIIDQYDPDGYPTRILFDEREFFGTEDLPGINRGRDRSYRIGQMASFRAPTGDGTSPSALTAPIDLRVTMLQPQLWNPHRPSPSSGFPSNFRIVADSTSDVGIEGTFFWDHSGNRAIGGVSYSDLRFYPNGTPVPSGPNCNVRIPYTGNAFISFNLDPANNLFREPTFISQVNYPPGSNSSGSPNNPDMALSALAAPNTGFGNPLVGIPDTIVEVLARNNRDRPVPDTNLPFNSNAGLPQSYQALGFVTGYLPGGTDPWLYITRNIGGPIILEMQYQDAAGNWWPFDKLSLSFTSGDIRFHSIQTFLANRADPRTDRWGSLYTTRGHNAPLVEHQVFDFGISVNPQPDVYAIFGNKYNTISPGTPAPGWTGVNSNGTPGSLQRNTNADALRYTDPDGVRRRATAAYGANTTSPGWPMHTNITDSRPVVLNRPFRSVAELGNVFRGTPWRNLDFMTPESGDRVLLDIFTVEEGPDDNIVAGRVNLNTRQQPVIQALIQGAGLVNGTTIDATTAKAMANELHKFTYPTSPPANPLTAGPLRDRSELVGRFVAGTTFAGPAESMANILATNDRPIERNRDVLIASLADSGTVRTWNILIDIIAQSGSVPSAGVFAPSGQSRVWQCVAIDRFTGEIVDSSKEIIND